MRARVFCFGVDERGILGESGSEAGRVLVVFERGGSRGGGVEKSVVGLDFEGGGGNVVIERGRWKVWTYGLLVRSVGRRW